MRTVSFCCNDPDNGLPLGRACAITLHGEDVDIELEAPSYPAAEMVCREEPLTAVPKSQEVPCRCDRAVKLGREWFGCYGWKQWYGNWCWDATRMPGVEALRMILKLREMGWKCVASECDFGDAYESGQPITRELLRFALSDEPSPVLTPGADSLG